MSAPTQDKRLNAHPLQYATEGLGGDSIWHTENTPTPDGVYWVRYDRCPTCEQWSPCDERTRILAECAAEVTP